MNIKFVDAYLRAHIGDKLTEQLLKQKQRLNGSLSSQSVDEVAKANDAFGTYLNDNFLREAYSAFMNEAGPRKAPPKSFLVETPELRRAREFLNDTQIFIASGVSIDRIGEVAGAAAKLRIALENLDEAAALEWMSRLHNFLDPMEGFTVFLQRKA